MCVQLNHFGEEEIRLSYNVATVPGLAQERDTCVAHALSAGYS